MKIFLAASLELDFLFYTPKIVRLHFMTDGMAGYRLRWLYFAVTATYRPHAGKDALKE